LSHRSSTKLFGGGVITRSVKCSVFNDVDYSLAVYTFRANGVNVLLLTEQCECVLTDCELYMFDRSLSTELE